MLLTLCNKSTAVEWCLGPSGKIQKVRTDTVELVAATMIDDGDDGHLIITLTI
jgi:hypothetical protein